MVRPEIQGLRVVASVKEVCATSTWQGYTLVISNWKWNWNAEQRKLSRPVLPLTYRGDSLDDPSVIAWHSRGTMLILCSKLAASQHIVQHH